MDSALDGVSTDKVRTVAPKIVTPLILLHSLFAVSGSAIALAFFAGAFIINYDFSIDFGVVWSIILALTLVFFLVIFFVSYAFFRMTLERTTYTFYSDRLEYFEGFLVKHRKTIMYQQITNVGQRQGVVEGLFNLGTVFFDTAGSSLGGHELAMSYLENPDQTYKWVVSILSKQNRKV